MVLPQQRNAESAPRKDPEFRHIAGVRVDETRILNKDPRRHYRLIDDGSDQRSIFCPSMYEQVGFRVEQWPTFEGLKGDALTRARSQALQFAGRPFGIPGEKMMLRGHVLMSVDVEALREMDRESQKYSDELADAIDPSKALARMRAESDPGRSKLALDMAGDRDMAGAERFDNVDG